MIAAAQDSMRWVLWDWIHGPQVGYSPLRLVKDMLEVSRSRRSHLWRAFFVQFNNNGVTLFEMMSNAQALRVTSSDHCDYENPTDWGCETPCLNQARHLMMRRLAQRLLNSIPKAILAPQEIQMQAVWTDSALVIGCP